MTSKIGIRNFSNFIAQIDLNVEIKTEFECESNAYSKCVYLLICYYKIFVLVFK